MKQLVLGNEKMKAVFERLLLQYETAHGPVTEAAEGLLLKIAYLELLHDQAITDLGYGLREKYMVSSFTSGTRENKALGQLMKIQTQQTRLLKELKMLPGAKATGHGSQDDELDDIDDY